MLKVSLHDWRLTSTLPYNRERTPMISSFSRRCWLFGLLGLVCVGSIGEIQAWERPPLKVNTVFQFKVEVKVGPEIKPPTAPWYAYFPADQRLMPSMQATPYPPWPSPLPPPVPLKDGPKTTANVSSGPMQEEVVIGASNHSPNRCCLH